MKKAIFYIFALCLLSNFVDAQNANGGASFAQDVNHVDSLIGKKCPNVDLTFYNYSKTGGKIDDFKGKLLILDFWATWCAPCRSFLSKADSIEHIFGDKVVILPVTDENSAVVKAYLDKYEKLTGRKIKTVVQDKLLNQIFKHIVIPHEVWISPTGNVLSITDAEQVNTTNIEKVLDGSSTHLKLKHDVKEFRVDLEKPVLTGTQGVLIPDSALLFSSSLTKRIIGLHSSSSNFDNSITILNESIPQLYSKILGHYDVQFIGRSNTILDVNDSAQFIEPHNNEQVTAEWDNAPNHLFCYELILKDSSLFAHKFDIAAQQLNDYFKTIGIEGRMEQRKRVCWVLMRTSNSDKLRSDGGDSNRKINASGVEFHNWPFSEFIGMLQLYYLQMSPIPIVDKSGITENVNMDLTCNMSNVQSINKALLKYELQFIKKEIETPTIVIRNIGLTKSTP